MPQKDPELINLDGLWQGILELSADVVQNRPPGGDDPGFCYSFYFYIAAEALAIRGWYLYNKVALAQPCTSPESVADCKASLRLSGDCYLKAAKISPEDDERHSWYLRSVSTSFSLLESRFE
ncbi:hypothetical protein PENSPDRAFT_331793 [Peniophora sp. CONT]|nr:hypothetical protein PENSPDRAFT_331793 [Peniophora sp. CONT]